MIELPKIEPPAKRLAYSRDGRHPGTDPIDKRITVGSFVVVITCVFTPMFVALNAVGCDGLLSLAFQVAISMAVHLKILRWADASIRPRVFDREQREHEIVPFRYATEEAHHVRP